MGGDESGFETIGETGETGGTDGLGLSSDLGSLFLEDLGAVGNSGNDGLGISDGLGLGVRVELLHHSLVLKRVSLGLVVEFVIGNVDSDSSEFGLNLVGVDNTGKIGAFDNIALHLVSLFALSLSGVRAEEVIE